MHSALFLNPGIGLLRTARAFVLQLNPGYSGVEDEIEGNDPFFSEALRANLSGGLPNLFLDRRFKLHPGRGVGRIASAGVASIERLASGVAQLELFPYHSERFVFSACVRSALLALPSVRAVRHFVHDVLVPEAKAGRACIVVQRSAREWNIGPEMESDFVVVYKGAECQGGWMTAKTRGGPALSRMLSSSDVSFS